MGEEECIKYHFRNLDPRAKNFGCVNIMASQRSSADVNPLKGLGSGIEVVISAGNILVRNKLTSISNKKLVNQKTLL